MSRAERQLHPRTPKLTGNIFGGACTVFLFLIATLASGQAGVELVPGQGQTDRRPALATRLTTTPTAPIKLATNPRYYSYGSATVALVGLSGEAIPHIGASTHAAEWCTYDNIPGTGKRKYKNCIDQLQAAGGNEIRLWVAFNQLVLGNVQVANESPFLYGPCGGVGASKWDLSQPDPTYFSHLTEVVGYAQSHGIIVEVTLFIPPTGGASPTLGPWANGKNCEGKYFRNPTTGVEQAGYFFQADNPAANPFNNTPIDTNPDNQTLRGRQVDVMKWVVNALAPYNNVIYELANEPDLAGLPSGFASFDNLVVWHQYMAQQLYKHEQDNYPTRHHLISANVAVRSVIDRLECNPPSGCTAAKIDQINSHYVKSVNNKPGVNRVDQLLGLTLPLDHNTYNASGVPGAANKKIWGMNETHITSATGALPSATVDSARAEAWHLMMSGGGSYDHLGYDWGNTVTTPAIDCGIDNSIVCQLGRLGRFLGTLYLPPLRRTMPDPTTPFSSSTQWVSVPGNVDNNSTTTQAPGCTDSSYCWAALEGGSHLLYIHHSGISSSASGNFRRYEPQIKGSCPASCLTSNTASCQTNCYADTLTLQKLDPSLGSCTGAYQAEWFAPNGDQKNAAGDLVPVPGATFGFNWSVGQTVNLPRSPYYRHDILLRVSQIGMFCP